MQWLGNLLCRVGWHRWEWKDVVSEEGTFSFFRCTNPSCEHHYWIQGNYEEPWKPW